MNRIGAIALTLIITLCSLSGCFGGDEEELHSIQAYMAAVQGLRSSRPPKQPGLTSDPKAKAKAKGKGKNQQGAGAQETPE